MITQKNQFFDISINIKKICLIFSFITFIFLGGCSGSSTGSSALIDGGGQSDDGFSGSNLEGGNVVSVDFNSSNSATVDLSDASETAEYILAITSYNNSSQTKAFELNGANSASNNLASLLYSFEASENQDETVDFHQSLREAEADLDPEASLINSSNYKAMVDASYSPAIGSTRSFKVLNSFSNTSSYETITAVLKYKTDNFLAYVDIRNKDSLTEDEWADLLENFDEVVDDQRDLFGEESDIDNTGNFNILFTQVVNELGGASGGGIVTGFFYAVDLFSSSTYSQSNQTEIFYTFVPDPQGEFGAAVSKSFALNNILRSVLPHEFQHMINFNQHYFVNSSSSEQSFLNEALSHLAEDIYSIDANGYMESTGNENPARVSGYLNSIEDLCLACGSSLYQRGGNYLFLRYYYEQAEKGNLENVANGATLIENLLDTNLTGVNNIVNAIYGSTANAHDRYRALLGQFSLAVFMSNTSLTDDDRFHFSGINLRASQSDNRGTVLQGPSATNISRFPLSDTISSAAIHYIQISSDDIADADGVLELELTSDAEVEAYLIQTGL